MDDIVENDAGNVSEGNVGGDDDLVQGAVQCGGGPFSNGPYVEDGD